MRLIDADIIDKEIQRQIGQPGYGDYHEGYDAALSTVQDFIADMPAIEAEKAWKGKWEWFEKRYEDSISPFCYIPCDWEWGWRCSKCETALPDDFDNPDIPPEIEFCPYCGAPMSDGAMRMWFVRWAFRSVKEAQKDGSKTD